MPLPRLYSRTPLREPKPLISVHKLSLYSPMVPLLPLRNRKLRQRGLLVLVVLLFLSTYIFFAQHSGLSPSMALLNVEGQHQTAAQEVPKSLGPVETPIVGKRRKHLVVQRPSVQLNHAQELAAVSSFLASLPQNVLPSSINPSLPIDPQLVLDFDVQSSRAIDELNNMVEDVWMRNPVFVYCKVRVTLFLNLDGKSNQIFSFTQRLHVRLKPFSIL